MRKSRLVQAMFVALFFATGLSGLGYQVLWAKSFAAGVGHDFPAVLAVITAFMGGIAVGACLYGQVRSFRSYGWLEVTIGLWAVATTLIIPAANRLMLSWLGPEPSAVFHWTVVFVTVFVVLFPATAAMGATFPAIKTLTEGNDVGLLYGANTAGAMVGVLAAAFWLMPRFGIPPSVLLLAGLNLMCGVVALRWPRGSETMAVGVGRDPVLGARLFVTGFLGIAFEIVMIRGLSQVLENTVFTFAGLLATYLCATALGAAFYQKAWSAFDAQLDVRWLFAGLALACSASGLVLRWIPELYGVLRSSFGDSLPRVALAEVVTAATVLFGPAFAMGATFAALADQSLRLKPNLSWGLTLSTCGSALAPAIFGLILFPRLGLKGALVAIALGYTTLIGKSRLWLVLLPVGLIFVFVPKSSDLARLREGERIVFHKEGAMAATTVIENASGDRVLKVNNRFQMGGTAARIAEERHADIPLLLHPAPRRALFIGLGTGITYGTAAHHPHLRADGVELLPEVVEAAPWFGGNPTNAIVADGRRFVLSSRERYDVIVADLFHPAQDGAGFLYTLEHFAAIKARLHEGGLFCQWLPVFQMDIETLRIVSQTFLKVFPHAEAWLLRFNVDTPVIGLIARAADARLISTWVEKRLDSPELAEHLRGVGLADSIRLFGCYLAGPDQLRAFASAAALNTDAHPVVMFQAPRLAFLAGDQASRRLLELLKQFSSGSRLEFEGPAFALRVANFIDARDLYLQALVVEAPLEAAPLFLASIRRSADFTPAYARAIALATALSGTNPEFSKTLLHGVIDAQPNIPVARQLLEQLKN